MVFSLWNPLAVSRRGGTVLPPVVILLSLLVSPVTVPAQADSAPAKREGSVMTNQEAWKLYEKYLSAWNTTSTQERLKIAYEVLSEDMEYQTARHDLSIGRSVVIEDMAAFQARVPGGHFEIGDVSSHHNVALLTWVMIQADGKEVARGGDQITVGSNGQITKIITFAPSVKNPN